MFARFHRHATNMRAHAAHPCHPERALRVIPMGRKSWLFCSTKLDARRAGIIQSLIVGNGESVTSTTWNFFIYRFD